MKEDNKWCVYMHTSPNNKKYIGITKQNPKKRWQNGYGYKTQMFYRAIQKYGWDNIRHEILKSKLSLEDANYYEKCYIRELKTDDPLYGYNCTVGGDGVISSYNDVVLQKINNIIVNAFINKKQCAKILGLSTTTVTKYCEDKLEHGGYYFQLIPNVKTSDFYKIYNNLFNEKYFDVKERIETEKRKNISYKLQRYHNKIISMYDLDGNYICTYNSKKEAEQELHIYIDMKYRRHGNNLFSYGKKEKIEGYKNPKEKRIVQIDPKINIVVSMYSSITNASIQTNLSYKNISKVLNGINKTAGGYIWRYVDEVENNTLEVV